MALTAYDPRLYGARYLTPFAQPGHTIEQDRYFAISGDRCILAFNTERKIARCRDSGDLGGSPGGVVFAGNFLWTVLDTGEVVQIAIALPDPDDGRGVILTPQLRVNTGGRGAWLLGGSPPGALLHIDNLSRFRVRDDGDNLASEGATSEVLLAPSYGAGVASLDPITGEVLDQVESLLGSIETAIFAPDVGRAYFADPEGRVAVVSVGVAGTLSLVGVEDPPASVASVYDRTLPNSQIFLILSQYKRLSFYSLNDPDHPELISVRDYRRDETHNPVGVLMLGGLPAAFETDADTFMDFQSIPVLAAVRGSNSSYPRDRVYLHGNDGAISYARAGT